MPPSESLQKIKSKDGSPKVPLRVESAGQEGAWRLGTCAACESMHALFKNPTLRRLTDGNGWRAEAMILGFASCVAVDPPQNDFGRAVVQRSGHQASTHLGPWTNSTSDM
jgi:hypothetical protein